MTNPLTRHFDRRKLFGGYPEEILMQMRIAREYIFHVGAEPRDGLLLQGALPTTDMLSKGTEGAGLGVAGEGIDAPTSLGVRIWQACPPEVDDVYGDPIPGKPEFKSPNVSMGLVEFDEKGDKTVQVEEWGHTFFREARVTLPFIHHLENNIPAPQEGDVVEFWARSWHELGVFYDVVHVARDGFINDTSYYVQWLLRCERRDKYLPERRLLRGGSFIEGTELPSLPEEEPVVEVRKRQQAFIVVDEGVLTYPLEFVPKAASEDVHWNGIHLVPGAGFASFLPTVRGYVIDGQILKLSSNVDLTVDDVITIEYEYLVTI